MAMSVGYVLLDVEPGSEYSVYEKASSLPFVSDAQVLFGDHDMILKVEAENMGEIAKYVVDSIRSIEGVTNTKTLACAEL
ncbi:MAG: AsnC family transcriptional regulator [Acidiferrobacter sp.]|nr:AsnC family transcriptional regulator [Acidiferrobacter sp.]